MYIGKHTTEAIQTNKIERLHDDTISQFNEIVTLFPYRSITKFGGKHKCMDLRTGTEVPLDLAVDDIINEMRIMESHPEFA